MSVNLEYLKVFYYVAKNKSITVAAEELFVSQPAVSQCIKQLEDFLGGILFLRTPKGMVLTQGGEVFYSYVSQGYEYMRLAESKFKELLTLDSGEIRIGASDMTLRFFLLPFLETFHLAYPKIKVSVTNAPTPETLKSLKLAKIDFGIVSAPVPEQNGLKIIPVSEIYDCLIASEHFSQFKNRKVSLTELENAPFILLEPNTSTRKYIDDFFNTYHLKLNVEFELATSDLIVEFAARGLGIGCVVRSFAQPYLESGKVFEIKLENPIKPRSICIITQDRNPVSPAGKRLLDLILK
jgi:DNA-binding transcriptional LysR family regulator